MDFDSCETVFLPLSSSSTPMPFYMHRRGVSCLILLALRSLGTLKKTSLPSISQRMNCERWWWDTEKAKPGPCSFHLSCSYNVSRIKLLISIPLLPRSLPSSFPFQNFNPRRLNKKKASQRLEWRQKGKFPSWKEVFDFICFSAGWDSF